MQREKTSGIARYLAALGACLLVALALALAPASAYAAGHEHDGVTFTAWTSTTELPSAPGSYYLANDVTLAGEWSVPPGGVKLCLDGHTLTMSAGTHFIDVPVGSTLDLYDKDDNTGELQGESAYGCMDVFGSFTMHGGTITNTISGVDVFAMGGGAGTFTMEGGVIAGLQSVGVLVGEGEYSGTFIMTGGAITGNEEYGGVRFNNGTLSMAGDFLIFDNLEGGKAKNVFLPADGVITVADKLANTEKVGVTTETKPTESAPVVITSGYGAKMGAASPWMYLASDDDACVVGWNKDKTEAVLAVAGAVTQEYSVTVSEAEHGAVTADKTAAAAGGKVTLTVTPAEGYELDALTVMCGEDAVDVKDGAFTMPEGDVTVTAAFKAKEKAPSGEGEKSEGAEPGSKGSSDKDAGDTSGKAADPSGSSGEAGEASAGISMRRLYSQLPRGKPISPTDFPRGSWSDSWPATDFPWGTDFPREVRHHKLPRGKPVGGSSRILNATWCIDASVAKKCG